MRIDQSEYDYDLSLGDDTIEISEIIKVFLIFSILFFSIGVCVFGIRKALKIKKRKPDQIENNLERLNSHLHLHRTVSSLTLKSTPSNVYLPSNQNSQYGVFTTNTSYRTSLATIERKSSHSIANKSVLNRNLSRTSKASSSKSKSKQVTKKSKIRRKFDALKSKLFRSKKLKIDKSSVNVIRRSNGSFRVPKISVHMYDSNNRPISEVAVLDVNRLSVKK